MPRPVAALLKASSLLVCLGLILPRADALLHTEFGGGVLTGPLVELSLLGCSCFVAALALAFILPRLGAIVAGLGVALCLPLSAYEIMPSSLTWLTSAPPSVRPDHLITVGVAPALSLVVLALVVSFHALLPRPALRPKSV